MKDSKLGSPPSGADVQAGSVLAQMQRRMEADRGRIAGELHDEVCGTLAAARMDVSWLTSRLGPDAEIRERLERVDGAVDRANRAARQIMQRLRPALLDHFGLPAALRNLVEETCRASGTKCDLTFVEAVEGVDPDLQIATYRLVEELLAGGVDQATVVATLQQDTASSVLVMSLSRSVPLGNDRRADIEARRIWIESLGGGCTVQFAAAKDTTTIRLPRHA